MSATYGKKQPVMVVDDTPALRQLIAMWLRSLGFNVVEATNGREAVELAPQVRPVLILMDLAMPVLNGFEATRQIRGRQETGDIPVIAVTAFTDKHSRQQALEAGCVDYVSKPVDFEVLGGVLRRHLHIH